MDDSIMQLTRTGPPCGRISLVIKLLVERDRAEARRLGQVDERTWLDRHCLDPTPVPHEELELRPRVTSITAGEGDHPRLVRPDGTSLGRVLADVEVAGDDDPALRRYERNPVRVLRPPHDWARRTFTFVERRTWVAGVGHVRPKSRHSVRKAEDVLIEVEPDLRGLHEAWSDLRCPASVLERKSPTHVSLTQPEGVDDLLQRCILGVLEDRDRADATN